MECVICLTELSKKCYKCSKCTCYICEKCEDDNYFYNCPICKDNKLVLSFYDYLYLLLFLCNIFWTIKICVFDPLLLFAIIYECYSVFVEKNELFESIKKTQFFCLLDFIFRLLIELDIPQLMGFLFLTADILFYVLYKIFVSSLLFLCLTCGLFFISNKCFVKRMDMVKLSLN